jgi:hypothetical protein
MVDTLSELSTQLYKCIERRLIEMNKSMLATGLMPTKEGVTAIVLVYAFKDMLDKSIRITSAASCAEHVKKFVFRNKQVEQVRDFFLNFSFTFLSTHAKKYFFLMWGIFTGVGIPSFRCA